MKMDRHANEVLCKQMGRFRSAAAPRPGLLAREFSDWLAEFRDVARVALADDPEWLERLGFLHRTEEV